MNKLFCRANWLFLCFALYLPLAAQATDCRVKVDQLIEQEQYAAAANCLLKTAQSAKSALDRADYALTAGTYFQQAEVFDSASLAFQLVINLPASTDRGVDSLRALAYHSLGLVYAKEKKMPRAINAAKKAVAAREKLHPAYHVDRARSLYSLGYYYLELNELDSAELALQESYLHYAKAPQTDTARLIRTLNTLAEVYRDLGDRQLVSSSIAKSTSLAERYYQNDLYELGDAFYRAATSMSNLGLSDQLIAYANQARKYYQQVDDYEWEGEALNVAASGYLEKEDYQTALGLFEQALHQWLKLDFYVPGTAGCYYNIGVCQYKLGKWEAAQKNAQLSIEYDKNEAATNGLAKGYQLAGMAAAQRGNQEKAAAFFQQSINTLFPNGTIPAVKEVPTDLLILLADVLDDRAICHELTGQLTTALADLQTVFALQDRIRADLNNPASQQYVSKRLRPIFQRAIHLHYQLYQQDQQEQHLWEALVLTERSKAFSLLAALENGSREQPKRERDLRRKIAQLERSGNQAEAGVAQLELQRMLQLTPRNGFEPVPLDITALKKYLNKRQLHLLEYAIGEENNYLILVTPTGKITMFPLQLTADFAQEIAQLRTAIEASAFKEVSLNPNQRDLDENFKVANAKVSSKVLVPFLQHPEVIPTNLLIVPDGLLAFIPFGALLTEPVQSVPLNYQTLPYLQRGRQLSYSYSAQYLLELEERKRPVSPHNLLAFAPTFAGRPAVKANNSSRGAQQLNEQSQRAIPGLLPLRYNQEEVEQIAHIVPATDVYFGPEANRSIFEKTVSNYRLIHLSSHALVDANDPNQSFIAFSQLGDSLEANEVLFLNDLYAIDLAAELAVLSACETSMGQYAPGEGVLSLARAFAQAGAASTLTTLWKVDDEATKELMVRFYAALQQQQTRSAAVTATFERATADATFAHPYFWSALTLYGSPDELALSNGSPISWWWWVGGITAVMLLGLAWLRK